MRNIVAYALPEFFWGCGWTMAIDNPLPAAFAKGFEGSAGLVGTFALCVAIGLGLPMLFTDYVVAPFRRKRGFLFWGHIIPALTLVLLAAWIHGVAGHGADLARIGYLAAYVLFFLAIGFQIPLWLGLVGDLFPHRMRARVLGIAFACNRTGAILGGTIATFVLDANWTANDQWAVLFGGAGLLMLVGTMPFLMLVEPRRRPRRRPPLRDYFRHLRDTWRRLPALRRFVAADTLGVLIFIVLFFYGDAAIRAHGAHESMAGVWARTYALAQLPLAVIIALVGDRLGPRGWMILGGLAATVAGIVASQVSGPLGYHVVAALLGAYMLIRMTCHGPEVMRLSGDGDVTIPIALSWAFVLPIQGLAPFLAGAFVIPETGYGPVFLGSAILSLVCVLYWWRTRADGPGG